MSLFTIDETKCKRDGICADECPIRLIELKDGAFPQPIPNADKACIECGHCVSVCPNGAFLHSRIPLDACLPYNMTMALTTAQAATFLRSRRSIRTYANKEVEADKLAALIDIARYAPTGSNSQQVKWHVIHSRAKVHAMAGKVIDFYRVLLSQQHPVATRYNLPGMVAAWEAGRDPIFRGAPSMVIAHAPKDYAIGSVDCSIALSYLDLAAPTFGLGACWAGLFMLVVPQYPPLAEELSLPEGNVCFGAMMVGYPKYKYHRLPPRRDPVITYQA